MIKNIIYTAVFLIGIIQMGFAQTTITSEKYFFSYETTIYCYDKDIVEGENIAKSFKLLY